MIDEVAKATHVHHLVMVGGDWDSTKAEGEMTQKRRPRDREKTSIEM